MYLDSISEATPEEIAIARAVAFSELPKWRQDLAIEKHKEKQRLEKLQYWLDNCGGDENHSAEWYCQNCDQEECGKRVAQRVINGVKVYR